MRSQILHEREEYGEPTFMSMVRETFLKKSNLRRLQMIIMAYLLAQMSGANAVLNYLPTIFALIGVKGTGIQLEFSGLYTMDKLVCCIFASLFIVDAFGRRKSLLTGITIQMLCHTYVFSHFFNTGH